jgi:hypothetical protein
MADESKIPFEQPPKSLDQLLAQMYRENERLRRQLGDAYHERNEHKKMYLIELARTAVPLTAEDIANSIPARPLLRISFVNRRARDTRERTLSC